MVNIYGEEIDETLVDLSLGRVERTIIPKPGVVVPPGTSKFSLPETDLMVVDMYLPYTKEELQSIEKETLVSDRDEIILDLMYQVDLLQNGIV